MFQNNLNDNDITLAACHTNSRTHKNSDIAISKNLTITNTIQSKATGNFHLSNGIKSIHLIGTYVCTAFQNPKALNCSNITITTQITAIAILKLISAVGIVIA
jgi:hypothetical protein